MARLIDWLQPPVFDDEEYSRAAALLYWSILVILTGGLVIPLLLHIFQPGERFILYKLFAVADICFLALLLLLRLRHTVQWVSWGFVSVVWIGFSVPIYNFDGVYDTAIIGYFIAIALAALLLGRWASALFCTLSIASSVIAYYLQAVGIIQISARTKPLPIDLIILTSGLMAVTLLLAVALHWINQGFAEARRNQQTLAQLNRELEAKIAQRTRQLDQANQVLHKDLVERQIMAEALRISEEKYRVVVENAAEAIVVAQDGKLKFFNNRLLDFTSGYTRAELLSLPFTEFIHPDDREMVLSRHQARSQSPDDVIPVYSFRVVDKNGEITWVEINTVRIVWGDKPAILFFLTDITERHQSEQALRESEARFRALFEHSPDAIVLIDPHHPEVDWPIVDCNEVFCRMNGYTRQELIGQSIGLIDVIGQPNERGEYLNTVRQAGVLHLESVHRRKDGSVFPVQIATTLINIAGREIVLGIDRDATTQKEFEEQLYQAKFDLEREVQARTAALAAVNATLKKSLAEKEVLLKEVHHRVKNNMQIISSLLSLQSSRITDPKALEIFQDSRYRVQSMALIHEKLYRSDNMARIDFAAYINDLVSGLFRSYQAHRQKIVFKLQADQLFLGLNQAIPCGLIINELVTNTLKYAFPDANGGCLYIGLTLDESGNIVLTITDNGIGIPPDLDFQHIQTLGLQLVHSLVAQLQGTLSQKCSGGTEYIIKFPQNTDKPDRSPETTIDKTP